MIRRAVFVRALAAAVVPAVLVFAPTTIPPVQAQFGAHVSLAWSCFAASVATSPFFRANGSDPACDAHARERPSVHLVPFSPANTAAALVAPIAPASFRAEVFERSIVFSWRGVGARDISASYVLEAGSSAGSSDLARLDTRSSGETLIATDVPPGVYFVRVRARTAAGVSGASNETTVLVPADGTCASKPPAPGAPAASMNDTRMTLTWHTSAADCAATSYVIEVGSAPGLSDKGQVSTGNAATSYVLNDVLPGAYYISVRGVNAAGAGPAREAARVTIAATTGPCSGAPRSPAALVANITSTTIALMWTASPDLPTSYVIEAGSAPGLNNLVVTDTASSTTAQAMSAAGGTYYIRVKARNTCGTSASSNEIVAVIAVGSASTPMPTSSPLVQSTSLIYEGSFRLPLSDSGVETFAYGGTALTFNAARGSLFLVGHDHYQQVAEVSVPDVLAAGNVSDLPVATLLQPLADATEGRLSSINPSDANPKKIGGLLPYGGRLYMTGYSYYDGAGTQVLSHFVSGLDLSIRGDVRGPFQVDSPKAGYASGYLGLVPPAWQSALGGPAFTGQCCISIIGRTSYGPALFTIDPQNIDVRNPVPVTPLVYYPGNEPLGQWGDTNPYFNGSTEVRGVIFPEGTRSVLFFGRHGVGTFCYGAGTSTPGLGGRPVPGEAGVVYCYDPEDNSKGTHGYPYAYYVWAYDAADLGAVKTGQFEPWQIKPYAIWKLTFPFPAWATHLNGAAYDPQTRRIFLSQAFADGAKPLVHVFTIYIP